MMTNILAAVTCFFVTNLVEHPLPEYNPAGVTIAVPPTQFVRTVEKVSLLSFEWAGQTHTITNRVELSRQVWFAQQIPGAINVPGYN